MPLEAVKEESSWIWKFTGTVLIAIAIFIVIRWLNKKFDDLPPREENVSSKKNVNERDDIEFIKSTEQSEGIEHVEGKEGNESTERSEAREKVCIPFKRPETNINKYNLGKGNNRSKGESICCQAMEQIFNKPFKTVRPSFLKNPETKRNLELDCFNEELRIAVEYNGIQHYKWPNFTGQTKDEFIKQVQRDKLKIDLCDRNNILLITVPYHIKHEEIPNYLYRQVEQHYKF